MGLVLLLKRHSSNTDGSDMGRLNRKLSQIVKPFAKDKKASQPAQRDPLYVIFEQHLYNFQDSDEDRKTFICRVIADYLTYLRKNNLSIPHALERPLIEELASQVRVMLYKKIYGFVSIDEFRADVPSSKKRLAKSQYRKIKPAA